MPKKGVSIFGQSSRRAERGALRGIFTTRKSAKGKIRGAPGDPGAKTTCKYLPVERSYGKTMKCMLWVRKKTRHLKTRALI